MQNANRRRGVWRSTDARGLAAAALFTSLGAIIVVGCDSGTKQADDDPATAEASAVEITVTVPPVRSTPFCQAMIGLSEDMLAEPPADPTPVILETYLSLLGDVPTEIESDFLAVIASLQELERTGGGTPPTTDTLTTRPAGSATTSTTSTTTTASTSSTLPTVGTAAEPITAEELTPDAEGYFPSDNPVDVVNAYVDFECRSSTNNPGPPETIPLDALTFDDTSDDQGNDS